MEIRTHQSLDASLCGTPVTLGPGVATVELVTSAQMGADTHGLVHGGFVFGLADHAAMLAVNEATVVLVSAESRFLRPVRVGERLRAEAKVISSEPPRYAVSCTVTRGADPVFEAAFKCHVPRRHVLAREQQP